MIEDDAMIVIVINEDSHGMIGIAKNYYNAARWLIKQHWIDNLTDCWDDSTNKWRPIEEILGKDWQEIITDYWNIEKFNNFFENSFYLEPLEVI